MYHRLLPDDPPPGGTLPGTGGAWDAAPDLERFLSSFYRYYEEGGFRGILAGHVTHLVALAFTIGFSFVLIFLVDWHAVLHCDSEESWRAVSLFYGEPFRHLGLWRVFVLVCFSLFCAYWIFNAVAAFHNVRDAAEMSSYYKNSLGIVSDEVLGTMSWSEVVCRLVKQQTVAPFCVVQDELTALEIANVIMREDNYMIALTNHAAFASRLPGWVPRRLAYSKSVLWSLRATIFYWIFDGRGRVRQEFVDRPPELVRRLRWAGVLHLLLVAPVLIFVTIYFFMRHAEEFRSHRSSPFQRQWSDFAHWTFREFNELPHQFRSRMQRAQTMAEAYVQAARTPSPMLDSFRRCVKYVAGSILAVLLVLALWDDKPLLFVKIQGKNLLWYLALFGFVVAVSDSAPEGDQVAHQSPQPGPSPQAISTPMHMYTAMMRLVQCTHFMPPTWRTPMQLSAVLHSRPSTGTERAALFEHFGAVRADLLTNYFCHRIQVLLEELLGVVLTPLLLGVYLPRAAQDIADIVRRTRHSSQNLGDWCSFGCLDLLSNGNEFYGGPPQGDASPQSMAIGELCERAGYVCRSGGMVSNGGKLEKSVLSFVLAHRLPGSTSGEADFDVLWHAPDESVAAGTHRSPLSHWSASPRSADKRRGQELEIPLASYSPPPVPDGEPREMEAVRSALEGEPACGMTPLGSRVWGYPGSALRFMHDLEQFHAKEVGVNSPHWELYGNLPEEFLVLPRTVPSPDKPPIGLPASLSSQDESEKGICGPHFFWLEMAYEFYSGRQVGPLGEAPVEVLGGGHMGFGPVGTSGHHVEVGSSHVLRSSEGLVGLMEAP